MITPLGNPLMANVADALPSVGEVARGTQDRMGSALPVLMIAMGILFLAVVWAVFIRKPAQQRQRGTILETSEAADTGRERRRRRRRRRDHRPRNPTLAETGGLPPTRIGEPPPPNP